MLFTRNAPGARTALAAGLIFATLPLQAAPTIEAGFSPEGSAQQLVIQTLQDARASIRLMGYTFTSPEITRELIATRARGVDVKVILDADGNRGQASQAAMYTLAIARVALRTVSACMTRS